MNERYHFILIVDIDAESVRATKKRLEKTKHPTFYRFSSWRRCGAQVRNEIGSIRLILLERKH